MVFGSVLTVLVLFAAAMVYKTCPSLVLSYPYVDKNM